MRHETHCNDKIASLTANGTFTTVMFSSNDTLVFSSSKIKYRRSIKLTRELLLVKFAISLTKRCLREELTVSVNQLVATLHLLEHIFSRFTNTNILQSILNGPRILHMEEEYSNLGWLRTFDPKIIKLATRFDVDD